MYPPVPKLPKSQNSTRRGAVIAAVIRHDLDLWWDARWLAGAIIDDKGGGRAYDLVRGALRLPVGARIT